MNDTIQSTPLDQLPADTDTAIMQLFSDIDEALNQMQNDRKEIVDLREQTKFLQSETESMLHSLKGMF